MFNKTKPETGISRATVTKEATPFSRRGQDIIIAAFGKTISLNAIPRALASRTDKVLKDLRNEGFHRAFVYAEHTPHTTRQDHGGFITVTYDGSPAQGDGWAVRFEVEIQPYSNHGQPSFEAAFYVPDVDGEAPDGVAA